MAIIHDSNSTFFVWRPWRDPMHARPLSLAISKKKTEKFRASPSLVWFTLGKSLCKARELLRSNCWVLGPFAFHSDILYSHPSISGDRSGTVLSRSCASCRTSTHTSSISFSGFCLSMRRASRKNRCFSSGMRRKAVRFYKQWPASLSFLPNSIPEAASFYI
jgi:hypothetical protein